MPPLPATGSLLVRTDFRSDASWLALHAAVVAVTKEGYQAYVVAIDDPSFDGASIGQLLEALPEGHWHSFLMVADSVAIEAPGGAVLVIDVIDEPGRTFRAAASGVQAVENNLSLANMDFGDFARAVGPDGVFVDFLPR